MKLTIIFALLTTGLFQLGISPFAELSYVVAGVLASIQGGRSIAQVTSQLRLANASAPTSAA